MHKFYLDYFKKQQSIAAWLLVFMMFLTSFSIAQERTISGTVTTSDTKETLPGASVAIKGTTTGTITDINGQFSMKVPDGSVVLVFSYVGYETQEIDAAGKNVIDVVLQLENISLDEVVVIGYGSVRKSDLSGSVGSVKAEDITKVTASNPIQSIQGRVTGVQIASPSGTPGENPVVRIRGVGTFNNSSPIYVVDGIILDDISFLNASDISSMEILKDASATAIYGSRGANGVILVTTKKGKLGKTVFNFSSELGIQRLSKKIDLLTGKEFAEITNVISPGTYNNVDAVPNTDWQDLIFNTAPIQNYQLSASGATDKMNYYLSIGYFNQQGIIEKSSYERLTIRFNNTYQLTDFLKFGNNISLAPSTDEYAPNVTYAAYRAQPLIDPYNEDGSYAEVPGVGNPIAALEYSNSFRKGLRSVGDVYGEATIAKDFVFKSSFGIDAGYYKNTNYTPSYYVSPQQQNEISDLSKSTNDNITWLWENTLTYNKEIGKHYVNAVAGYTMQKTRSEFYNLAGSNLIRDGESFWYIIPTNILDDGNNVNTVSSISNGVNNDLYYSLRSYLFRVNYTYNDRYIFTATFRRDGSSKFSKDNRYSNFPSLAVGWNIAREDFMQQFDFLSRMKLRASWGKVGNEKIPYLNRFSQIQSDIISIFGTDPSTIAAASYGLLGNPDLKWETTTQIDIGLEIGFFNDRLTGEFDYYHRVTDDILLDLSIPGYYGNGTGQKVTFNAASVLNRGFEFNVGWRDQIGQVKYGFSALGTTVHNEILEMGGSAGIDSVLIGGYLANGQPVTRSEVGIPIGSFYGYQTDGIFQTQAELDAYPHQSNAGVGDLRFVDLNDDGKINSLDRTYIGSPIPKFIFGFNFDLSYRNIDFSLGIQGQTGNKLFNGKEVVRPDPYNFERHVLDYWDGPGSSDTEPRPSFGGYNYSPSDKFIYDGSYLRIRNVMLGYSLPVAWSQSIHITKARIYVKIDNLHTFTKYTGYSPEIGGDELSTGIDNGIYPITAVYSAGLNLTF
ncbi:MAG TPA: TonB-dependent receptor [Bacteroidales bacterium]|nr:TonB-dependent receptor [Bacteroidales bacterium]